MRSRLLDMKGFALMATDGELGRVDDILFDDADWVVRYLVVRTNGLLADGLVLISPSSVSRIDWSSKQVFVNLTRARVEASPSVSQHQPVSRQTEEKLSEYYDWPAYWRGPLMWGARSVPHNRSTTAQAVRRMTSAPKPHHDPHLRSANVVAGYHVRAVDGEIGHISDFAFEDDTWLIPYLVVDTSDFWFGRFVIVSVHWLREIKWDEERVYVDLPVEEIRDAPPFDIDHPISLGYEQRLHQHYRRSGP